MLQIPFTCKVCLFVKPNGLSSLNCFTKLEYHIIVAPSILREFNYFFSLQSVLDFYLN